MEKNKKLPPLNSRTVTRLARSLTPKDLKALLRALRGDFSGTVRRYFTLDDIQIKCLDGPNSAMIKVLTSALENFAEMAAAGNSQKITFAGLEVDKCEGKGIGRVEVSADAGTGKTARKLRNFDVIIFSGAKPPNA